MDEQRPDDELIPDLPEDIEPDEQPTKVPPVADFPKPVDADVAELPQPVDVDASSEESTPPLPDKSASSVPDMPPLPDNDVPVADITAPDLPSTPPASRADMPGMGVSATPVKTPDQSLPALPPVKQSAKPPANFRPQQGPHIPRADEVQMVPEEDVRPSQMPIGMDPEDFVGNISLPEMPTPRGQKASKRQQPQADAQLPQPDDGGPPLPPLDDNAKRPVDMEPGKAGEDADGMAELLTVVSSMADAVKEIPRLLTEIGDKLDNIAEKQDSAFA